MTRFSAYVDPNQKMKLTPISIIWVFIFTLLRSVNAADSLTVYCADPVLETRTISFCGSTKLWSVFPGEDGYDYLLNGASLTTLLWSSNYVSVTLSVGTISTTGYQAFGFYGTCTSAKIAVCASTQQVFTALVTYYTVYTPTAGVVTTPLLSTTTATVTTTATEPADTVTVTDNQNCPLMLTTTKFVSYSYGTTGELTFFTFGPSPGTSTYTTCLSV